MAYSPAIILFFSLIFITLNVAGKSYMDTLLMILPLEMVFLVLALTNLWHHIIMLVILLEFFSIKGFLTIGVTNTLTSHPSVMFFFIVLMVCEASLGLSMITGLTRGAGNDEITT